MSKDLAQVLSIEDRISDKIKEKLSIDFTSIVSESDFKELAKKAIDESFFKERVIKTSSYSEKREPSYFVEQIVSLSKSIIQSHIEKYISENQKIITDVVDAYLSENALQVIVAQKLVGEIHNQIGNYTNQLYDIQDKLNNARLT